MADGGKSVAVLGGGIAGLSVAHQLCTRGYRVTVFETRGRSPDDLGGKARSYSCTDEEGRSLYGEHGFRFFPGFYSHVIETMEEIPMAGTGTVADGLMPLKETAFYARPWGSPRAAGWGTKLVQGFMKCGTFLFVAWLVWGVVLWYREAGLWWWGVWILLPIGWLLVRTILIVLSASTRAELKVPLPTIERRGKDPVQRVLLRLHPAGRWVALVAALAAFVALLLMDRSWRAVPLLVVATAVVFWYPILATINYLWRLIGEIPVKLQPGIVESIVAFVRVAAVVTSSKRRLYTQWEHNSWWSYLQAYRYSRYFKLAYATGLTRAFVATRAEEMSARTGATILAQLLFDVSRALPSRTAPADRVLDAPTHDAWITPWVTHLEKNGVHFNKFDDAGTNGAHDCVEVTRLLTSGSNQARPRRIDGFEFVDRRNGRTSPQPAPQSFDHYVLAVSGTAAQRILANSDDLIRADRNVTERPKDLLGDVDRSYQVPYLDGIFSLKFGWMTGIVFHLVEDIDLPHGHLLCLESDWALTAVEQSHIWRQDVSGWKALVSVNVSDWFTPSSDALPAHFETVPRVADETWRQLRAEIPALERIKGTPVHIADTAINEPDPRRVQQMVQPDSGLTVTAHLENLPLTNEEKLLVNTAGSWTGRPTAQTVFNNLVIAGDYVRTCTDFASMESADEAAKRAVNVILEHDKNPYPRCTVRNELPIPSEFKLPVRVLRAVDAIALSVGLPHPLMALATPIGWIAGAEVWLRARLLRFREWLGRTVSRLTHRRRGTG